MPILLVDTTGTLIFYNEPAEAILGQRFEETGEIAADTWSRLFALAGSFCASDSGLGVLQAPKTRLKASAGITGKETFMPTKYQKLK